MPVVDAAPAKYIVSVVIAMLSVLAALINVMAVPTGYATLEFAGIVKVRALLSVDGCKICLPASARTKV